MKYKILLVVIITIFLITFSSIYSTLIFGSDAIEIQVHFPIEAKLLVAGCVAVILSLSINIKKSFTRYSFIVIGLLAFCYVNQTVYYSGKQNSIMYQIFGVTLNSIPVDPTNADLQFVDNNFVKQFGVDGQFVTFISLPCPVCLDTTILQALSE